jgi:hypothetical protein
MAGESFCRPVINSTKKTYLTIGIVVGIVLALIGAWLSGRG